MPSSSFRSLCAGIFAVLPLLVAGAAVAQNGDDSYRPDDSGYSDRRDGRDEAYRPPADDYDRAPRENYDRAPRDNYNSGRRSDYGDAYAPPAKNYDDGGYPEPQSPGRDRPSTYDQGEIVAAGHSFFGAVTKGLASAVEYAFKSQGRPNGYILGEDAGGAFVIGLRYGEGKLFTKDAGVHKLYWQGPSLGYDMGAEGSKTMVLVYNMHDPSEIYERFAGAEGSAYLVGGVSVQFQTYGHVTLGVIRSGVGIRLGANIGYSKYSRQPTWNPL